MTAFTERTTRLLRDRGFLMEESYLKACLVISDVSGGFYGHFTESEARKKLLRDGESNDGKTR